ncbi:MAG: S8 family serine peptidase [Anaerolineae bacterium]
MTKLRWLNILLLFAMLLAITPVAAQAPDGSETVELAAPIRQAADSPAELEPSTPRTSHRLIVELESPPLSVWSQSVPSLQSVGGRLNVDAPAAQAYVSRLETEQAAFRTAMQSVLPQASVSGYINEFGARETATYQILFNGLAVDPGEVGPEAARRALAGLPGVKRVYLDYAYTPQVYTSTHLINAPVLWSELGGQADAGAGVKVASMDGGLHHAAPMFDGTGFDYPADFPPNGLGFTENNNGKIIASRVYFREWDPPSAGDENPWPGTRGTPHGNHTGSIAAGNVMTDVTYLGADVPPLSGVAPGAWLMSYRVFYNSVTNDGSFYTAEGLAALEDIVADGADVLNNSWGGGPGSLGGEFDALDAALINAAEAGIFVSMSNGNAGPGLGTGDHPSPDYINVAASSTGGTYRAGRLSVIAPEPISPTLQNVAYGTADFGAPLPQATVITHTYLSAANVTPANTTGCDPFPADAFTGHAAVISRGGCTFSTKVYYAQEAGAEFAVIYNNDGDELINMAGADFADQVTISSVFIGQTAGEAMVDKQAEAETAGVDAVLELNTIAFQAGNVPDVIANFSSRGPGVGNVLKPDVAAPGVNIIAQGFTPGAVGEDRHLGYGQASGTSMAAPHVAGAAALLRALHPDWSNADIKSALMSTSKYLEVYNADGSPAQPLDMGAGRIDVGKAADPGVILDPPSLSFGLVMTGTSKTLTVAVRNITDATETYELSTLYTGDGFENVTTTLPGFSVAPSSVTLAPGASTTISVTFDSTTSAGIGDNQGFIILAGDQQHEAHAPAWARTTAMPAEADVLIIDVGANSLLGFPDYLAYYTNALDDIGLTYDVWDAGLYYGRATTIPDAATLMAYDTILIFTGDNFYPDGTFTVSTPLTSLDMNILTEYANAGGTIIAMGQDLSSVLGSAAPDSGEFFYSAVLGGNWLQDSVTAFGAPGRRIVPHDAAPAALADLDVDIGVPMFTRSVLAGYNEVPPVATTTSGEIVYGYEQNTNTFDYQVMLAVSDTVSITAAHIHSGTVDVNGPALVPIFPFTQTQVVTETLSWSGDLTFTQQLLNLYLAGNLYVNVHSTDNPAGEVRAQLVPHVIKDGAGNQWYVDEIAPQPWASPGDTEGPLAYTPLLMYPGANNIDEGVVAMAHRDQPTLERPGITYLGRSVYTTFGLEGVNDVHGGTSRSELLSGFLAWAADEPMVTINNVTPDNASSLTVFEAELTSNITDTHGVSFRWDFGDGSSYTPAYATADASHTYATCGTYTVRVEAVDSWGNRVVGSADVDVDLCLQRLIYLPVVVDGVTPAP